MIAKRSEELIQAVSVIVPPILLRSMMNVSFLLLTAINGTLSLCIALSVILTTSSPIISAIQIVRPFTQVRARLTTLLISLNASVMTSIFPLTLRPAS